ncbi:auxin response factor 4-like [Lolium perenne]|uniref:auxin response factor 4-like n=1 Tax=Lolium perenne TaxID=4522 RepID=UPI003A99C0C4
MNQIARNQMRFYDLPYKLLGRVINVEFKADTDEDSQDMTQSPPTQELAQRICMAWTCAVALPPHLQRSLLFLWLNMTT